VVRLTNDSDAKIIDSKNSSSLSGGNWQNFSQPISPDGTYTVKAWMYYDCRNSMTGALIGKDLEKSSPETISVTVPGE
jgi:hypothetical protein